MRSAPIWAGPPATVIVDGYGEPGLPSVVHIAVGLRNTPIGVGEPVGVKVGVGVAVAVAVLVGVPVTVAVGVAVPVGVCVAVPVAVPVAEAVGAS